MLAKEDFFLFKPTLEFIDVEDELMRIKDKDYRNSIAFQMELRHRAVTNLRDNAEFQEIDLLFSKCIGRIQYAELEERELALIRSEEKKIMREWYRQLDEN